MVSEIEAKFIITLANHNEHCPLSEEELVTLSPIDKNQVGDQNHHQYTLKDINEALESLQEYDFTTKEHGKLNLNFSHPYKLQSELVDSGPFNIEKFRCVFGIYYDVWYRSNG